MLGMLIRAGRFIDGTDGPPLKNVTLHVEDGRVKAVNPASTPDDCVVHDYGDYTVMPGLINCHIHLDMPGFADFYAYFNNTTDVETAVRSLDHLNQYIRSGVTYVRSLGVANFIDVKFRDLINRGLVKGPGIVAAGPNICITGGHGWHFGTECDGVNECIKAVRYNLKRGVDCIKFMATGGVMTPCIDPGSVQMEYDEMAAVVREAHKAGKLTAAHAQGRTGIEDAVRAGVDTIEHATYLTDEVITRMLAQGTIIVPTLSAPYNILKNGIAAGIPAYQVNKCELVSNDHIASFKKAYAAGVKIAAGTDAGTPFNMHSDTCLELKLMIDYGMKPMDALHAATRNAAEALGIAQDYGTLEPGKKADLIAVEGNPLEEIEALTRIRAVFRGGEQYYGER